MDPLMIAWVALCSLVAMVWVRRHQHLTRARRNNRSLSSTTFDGPPNPAPSVSVIIAAKDEEPNIDTCVRTLLEQDYPNCEITVVNDRSDDRTGPILDRMQSDNPDRLHVLHVDKLPDGWFGKPNAIRTGLSIARGDYLLFSDADCEHISTRTISTAVRYAIENDVEFLSVLPVIEPSCFWETIIQPVCTAVLMMWHNPEKVNDPKRPEAYANGAFMLIRRETYERIGGHERVRTSLCEDMQLARNAKSAGVTLRIIQNTDLYTTRMYDTFARVWGGWSRIFQGSLQRPPKLLLAMTVLTVSSLMPAATVALSVIKLTTGDVAARGAWTVLLVASGVAVLALQSLMVRFYTLIGAPIWKSLTYTPAALVCVGILADAMRKVLGFGSTTWRGTTYAGRRVRASGRPAAPESPAHVG